MTFKNWYQKKNYLIKEIRKTTTRLNSYSETDFKTRSAQQRILKLTKHLHCLTEDLDWTCQQIELLEVKQNE